MERDNCNDDPNKGDELPWWKENKEVIAALILATAINALIPFLARYNLDQRRAEEAQERAQIDKIQASTQEAMLRTLVRNLNNDERNDTLESVLVMQNYFQQP